MTEHKNQTNFYQETTQHNNTVIRLMLWFLSRHFDLDTSPGLPLSQSYPVISRTLRILMRCPYWLRFGLGLDQMISHSSIQPKLVLQQQDGQRGGRMEATSG